MKLDLDGYIPASQPKEWLISEYKQIKQNKPIKIPYQNLPNVSTKNTLPMAISINMGELKVAPKAKMISTVRNAARIICMIWTGATACKTM